MSLEPGTEIGNVASIGNQQLSLPPGEWEFVMSEADRRGAARAGSAFLVRTANGGIADRLFVSTTLETGGGNGWKRAGWCDRSNVHHNGSDKYYNKNDAFCWMLVQRVSNNKVYRADFYNRMGGLRSRATRRRSRRARSSYTSGLGLEPMGPFSCSDRGDSVWL